MIAGFCSAAIFRSVRQRGPVKRGGQETIFPQSYVLPFLSGAQTYKALLSESVIFVYCPFPKNEKKAHKVCSCMAPHTSCFCLTHKHTHNAAEVCPPPCCRLSGSVLTAPVTRRLQVLQEYLLLRSHSAICTVHFSPDWMRRKHRLQAGKTAPKCFLSFILCRARKFQVNKQPVGADADGGTRTDILQISAPEVPR